MDINKLGLAVTHLNSLTNFPRGLSGILTIYLLYLLGICHGISLTDVISQEGTFYGMYPTTVLDFDGNVRPSPISIVQDQQGPNVHFLDMQIIQLSPGICDVKMYDKRDSMLALASYRKFPHIETTTTVSTSCKYAVLHSQLCRFAFRCTRRDYFVDAASRLMRDMWLHGYDLKFLRCKLYNFQTTFWITSRILLAAPCKKTRRIFWHKLVLGIYTNATRPVTVKV